MDTMQYLAIEFSTSPPAPPPSPKGRSVQNTMQRNQDSLHSSADNANKFIMHIMPNSELLGNNYTAKQQQTQQQKQQDSKHKDRQEGTYASLSSTGRMASVGLN